MTTARTGTQKVKRQIVLGKMWKQIGYEPHRGQKPVHAAGVGPGRKRFRVVCAGRRTGKSFLGGHELTLEAFKTLANLKAYSKHGRRREFWIVGPEYSDAEKEFRVVYNDLEQLGVPFDHPGTYYDAVGGNLHISCFDGRFQVHGKSAKYPKSLVGEALEGVILVEAAKLAPSIWTKFIRPMLVDYRGWALMTSTPEGKNWFYEAWQRGQQGKDEWWSTRMPAWINDIIYPGGINDPEIALLRDELGPEMFNQEVAALFTEYTGRVFKEFDEEIHCKPLKFNPAFETVAAVDYGFTNPNVWLLIQIDPWDNVYILDEFYQRGLTVDEFAAEVASRGLAPPQMKRFYPDPASPGDTRYISDKLKLSAGTGTGGEVNTRINLIRRWLRTGPTYLEPGDELRQPKLFIDSEKCPNTVREFQDYRYPENKSEIRDAVELPMKKDDHTPEALGRLMASRFGRKMKSGRARQRTASFAR
jgi:hypothetical protein